MRKFLEHLILVIKKHYFLLRKIRILIKKNLFIVKRYMILFDLVEKHLNQIRKIFVKQDKMNKIFLYAIASSCVLQKAALKSSENNIIGDKAKEINEENHLEKVPKIERKHDCTEIVNAKILNRNCNNKSSESSLEDEISTINSEIDNHCKKKYIYLVIYQGLSRYKATDMVKKLNEVSEKLSDFKFQSMEIQYDEPYYSIILGKFLTEMEADEYRMRINSELSGSKWPNSIVRKKIVKSSKEIKKLLITNSDDVEISQILQE